MPKAERFYKNEQLAKKPSFEGNREILRTIFQPRASSSDIPASRREVYLFYNPPNNFSTRTHLDPSCIFCGFFRFPWYGIFNQLFNFSLSGFCKIVFFIFGFKRVIESLVGAFSRFFCRRNKIRGQISNRTTDIPSYLSSDLYHVTRNQSVGFNERYPRKIRHQCNALFLFEMLLKCQHWQH